MIDQNSPGLEPHQSFHAKDLPGQLFEEPFKAGAVQGQVVLKREGNKREIRLPALRSRMQMQAVIFMVLMLMPASFNLRQERRWTAVSKKYVRTGVAVDGWYNLTMGYPLVYFIQQLGNHSLNQQVDFVKQNQVCLAELVKEKRAKIVSSFSEIRFENSDHLDHTDVFLQLRVIKNFQHTRRIRHTCGLDKNPLRFELLANPFQGHA